MTNLGAFDAVRIRPAEAVDLPRLHVINEQSTPGVGSVTLEQLSLLLGMSCMTLVAERTGVTLGFILCMTEGAAYQSPNYRWIADRYRSFAYCDRIAIAPEARGQRLGERLYAAALQRFAGMRSVLLCEVNLAPPNPRSRSFHERIGFHPVGEAWSDDRSKGVVYLEKPLDQPIIA